MFRPDGHSDFEAIQAGGSIAAYVAFDLLALNGKDVRRQPIEDRRGKLLGRPFVQASRAPVRMIVPTCSPRSAAVRRPGTSPLRPRHGQIEGFTTF